MLKKEVAALLEQQINKEFYSAYLYLDMSNYYYSQTRYMSPSAILWPPLWSTKSMSPPSSTPSMLRP